LIFATRDLSQSRRGGGFVGRAEDAYGPSLIDSSTRNSKQIDLWMDMVRLQSDADFATIGASASYGEIKVDRWRLNG
jgi:hypothetical protein